MRRVNAICVQDGAVTLEFPREDVNVLTGLTTLSTNTLQHREPWSRSRPGLLRHVWRKRQIDSPQYKKNNSHTGLQQPARLNPRLGPSADKRPGLLLHSSRGNWTVTGCRRGRRAAPAATAGRTSQPHCNSHHTGDRINWPISVQHSLTNKPA